MYEYNAKIVRWVDGDTVDLEVDLGFTVLLRQRFRLLGINTPEVRGAEKEAGHAATAFASALAPLGSAVVVVSTKTGKFGRWLGEIYPTKEGGRRLQSIDSALLEAGHAVPYGG